MAELPKERPAKVGKIPVQLPGGRETYAHSLDDVTRQIIFDMKEANEWSWPEAAQHLGVSLPTLQDLMEDVVEGAVTPTGKPKKPKGITTATLSKIIAARAHNNPVLFFARHPLFRKSPLGREQSPEEQAYERLCTLLTGEQATLLSEVIEVLLDRSALDDTIGAAVKALGISQKKARRERVKKSG